MLSLWKFSLQSNTKHQVIRRALELNQDDLGRHDLSAPKQAAIYAPHAINQTAMVRGFTPQQWVLGKSVTHVHGLTFEIFNPGQEPLDEAGAFSQIQNKPLRSCGSRQIQTQSRDEPSTRSFGM